MSLIGAITIIDVIRSHSSDDYRNRIISLKTIFKNSTFINKLITNTVTNKQDKKKKKRKNSKKFREKQNGFQIILFLVIP